MKSRIPMIILCVEDEDSQLELRKMLFESAGFEFLGARKAVEALEVFRTKDVSAVVLDYWMSGMNGIEIATEMKRLRPTIPIIMLSGFPSLPGEGVGLVDAWLQKGRVQPEALIEQVSDLIKRKTAEAVE
jgi:DNA-binding response OmpR family regulator